MVMRIGFYDHGIGFRGTTRAIYEYARCLMDKEGVEVLFFFKPQLKSNNFSFGIEMLNAGIQLRSIASPEEISEENLDFFYYVSSAPPSDYSWISSIRACSLLHQVGYQPPDYNTCDFFAYTGHWQSFFFSSGQAPVLPYIVEDKSPSRETRGRSKLRKSLEIPEDAIVLGRHGGLDTWNLQFSNQAVVEAASRRDDLHFIFLNTPKFSNLPNIHFIEGTHDALIIQDYLECCDAMLHARWEGETFGLACAEFLIRRKPIITWSESRERNHIFLADKSAIFFNTYNDLLTLLLNIGRDYIECRAEQIPLQFLEECLSSSRARTSLLRMINGH